ncbi:MAG: hypothetical protein U1E22_07010, partial [Coriobacteriia bacterium]|nr:hypothetical protein [Coriobacteriia bacterium]
VSRVCTPGSEKCSEDFTKALRCDATGTAFETLALCDDDEACQNGACVSSPTPLGEVVAVQGAALALSPGRYAIAIVDGDASGDDWIPYPVEITGSLSDPPIAPKSKSVTLPVSGASTMLWGRPALAETVVEEDGSPQDDGTRVFHVPDYHSGGTVTLARSAKLRATGQRVNLWEDQTTAMPGSQLPDSLLPDLLQRIDQAVIPRAASMIGVPTDVDGNGRIDILFTDVLPVEVAAFTYPSATLFAPGSHAVTYDFGEVVYAHGVMGKPAWETATLMSHEVAQLIYLGNRLAPYLEDPSSVPGWVEADIYAVEGLASVAMGWSGQSWAWPAVTALENFGEMSLWRLTASSYLPDSLSNLASYGFGTLVQEYLFDQAGAMVVKGGGLEDAGGLDYVQAFVAGESGWDRLSPADGRTRSEWYADFATALLLLNLEGKVSAATASDSRYAFAPTLLDDAYGGFIGPTLRYEDMLDAVETGPILRPVGWSERPSQLRRGGASWVVL